MVRMFLCTKCQTLLLTNIKVKFVYNDFDLVDFNVMLTIVAFKFPYYCSMYPSKQSDLWITLKTTFCQQRTLHALSNYTFYDVAVNSSFESKIKRLFIQNLIMIFSITLENVQLRVHVAFAAFLFVTLRVCLRL